MYYVVSGDKLRCVFIGETALVQFGLNLGIDVVQPVPCRLELAPTDVLCSVKNLPLKIGQIDVVEIDNAEGADAGACQLKRGRRSESSGADSHDSHSVAY